MQDNQPLQRIPASTRSLEERLWQIESERAIRDLLHTFRDAGDREEIHRYMRDFFHEGATITYADLFSREPAVNLTRRRTTQGFKETFHLVGNVEVRVSGTTAVSQCYFFSHHIIPPDMSLDFLPANRQPPERGDQDLVWYVGGRYCDELAYRDGRWGVTHRTAINDWQYWMPEIPGFYRKLDILPRPVDELLDDGRRADGRR